MPPQANPKRKRQDEVTLQSADSLSLMFSHFNKTFHTMQNKIDQKYRETSKKGQCTTTTLLKVKVILHNSNSAPDYKMILRTFLMTKISTTRPLKL